MSGEKGVWLTFRMPLSVIMVSNFQERLKVSAYDMATYPGIYVYDAPGINPSALWQLWSWNFIFLSWD